MDATCVLGGISRLVHDCNRPPDAPDAMPAKSEVFEIPGNTDLSPEQRGFRVETVYKPFHACVAAEMTDRNALVTVHSFTPVYKGVERHVELGILHDEDTALADVMLSLSSGHPDLQIRRNEPYGPQDGVMHTLKVHGLANGIPNVMIEIRSDLIATKKACEEMAVILAHMISQGLDAVLASSTGRERHA